ncbi:hypothetical protein GGU11DRAFT_380550 [Lentinula aff. detonsa]|nr:hypothetical protein GGU11DRAFT_380550 [Lentinula aff. detonsa]
MNAKARNEGLDIEVFRPELDNRGIPIVPVEGDTTLSGYKPLMERQAGQEELPEKKKKEKKKKGKKVKIQETLSGDTVKKDSDEPFWVNFKPVGRPLGDIDRTQFRIDFVVKFKKFIREQGIPSFRMLSNIQIAYTLSPDPGAGGQPHKIVKFEFKHQKTCGAHPCTGFLDFSSGKFGISDSNGKTIYLVGPSSSQIAKSKVQNPSIPHPPAGYHGKPSSTIYDLAE